MSTQEFGSVPFNIHLERDGRGRITRKLEQVAGGELREYNYRYDQGGRLSGVDIGYGEAESYEYDENGLRTESRLIEPKFHTTKLYYQNTPQHGHRLVGIGNSMILHDDNGFRTYREQQRGPKEHYHYAPDYRLLRVEKDGLDIQFDHDENGQRIAKYVNGKLEERYAWHDLIRLAACENAAAFMEFHYDDGARMPYAMTWNGHPLYLFYDQVGSLRVIADEQGNVIKEIRYDSFGRIVEDSNPAMMVPLGFAGGLHDRDVGWVRFGYRDYDPLTARFTAKDPLGYAGGDNDLYGYCLDDPVNLVDPKGLEGGFWSGMEKIGAGFGELWDKAPAGIGEAVTKGAKGASEAFGRLGEEYATNKDLQKYTGIALGAGALPIAAAATPEIAAAAAPHVGKVAQGARAVANAAKGKVKDAATAATGTILGNPEKVANATKVAGEFVSGAIAPGPPESTPGGYAGGVVRKAYDLTQEQLKRRKTTGR